MRYTLVVYIIKYCVGLILVSVYIRYCGFGCLWRRIKYIINIITIYANDNPYKDIN